MAGRIYLLNDSADLMAMEEAPYDSEQILQELLAKYPDLLAGEQINSEEPRRWLLVSREMAVPDEEDGSARWSLDHLFLDQDAVPTLVEVKRSSDSRIRRKVVGQMLDYAANAVVYWPVEEIRSRFESRCEKVEEDPDGVLADFLAEEKTPDEFWQQVKTNLQAGRIRMVFLADMIPPELRRIVEFLNAQMDPAEVLALEVKQFVGKGMKTLVPRVLGQTETARQKKASGTASSNQWDEPMFMDAILKHRGQAEATVARQILDWAKERGLRLWWGKGRKIGSFFPLFVNQHGEHFLFAAWTNGSVELQFQHMRKPPFSDHEKRQELAHRLSEISGVSIPEDALSRRPSLGMALLTVPEALANFLKTFDWVLSEIKKLDEFEKTSG